MKKIKIDGREFPSEITILSRCWKVVWVAGPVVSSDHDVVCGLCDPRLQTLTIDLSQADDALAEVLLHEIGHAAYYMFEHGSMDRSEEDIVNLNAMLLITLGKQNPGFWAWVEHMTNP